jgi:hypothetical protein
MEIELSLLIPPPSPADRAKWQLLIDAQNLYAATLEKGRPDLQTEKLLSMNTALADALNNTLEWVEYANRAFENQNKILELENVRNPWIPKA